uniref:hypothetical protein n=1 Tax=Nocardia amamiensis TaxID=404578 RepID=UPI001C3F992D
LRPSVVAAVSVSASAVKLVAASAFLSSLTAAVAASALDADYIAGDHAKQRVGQRGRPSCP